MRQEIEEAPRDEDSGRRIDEYDLEWQRLAPDARNALQVFIHALDLERAVPPILGAALETEHEHVGA